MPIGSISKSPLVTPVAKGSHDSPSMVKVDLSGSIENGFRGLRLKGENLMVGKSHFYATSKFGQRGFYSIEELDPRGSGDIVGGKARDRELADTSSVTANGKPFGFYALTGVALSRESNQIVVYGFQRKHTLTAFGRLVGIGAEERFIIGTFDDALAIGGGEAAPGSSGGFAYDEKTKVISAGAIAIARQFYRVDGLSNATDGTYRIAIDMEKHTGEIELGDGFAAPTDTMTYAPLFVITDGKVSVDYRGAIIAQAWE